MKEVIAKLQKEYDDAMVKRRACWRDDVEDKSYYDGQTAAYREALSIVKEFDRDQKLCPD